jgi:hypothetical protein
MTCMTVAPTAGDYTDHPDYLRGRADAGDHALERTVDEMVVLLSMAIDYASIPYAEGYADRVTELRLELDTVAPLEMELAHTRRPKQDRRPTAWGWAA